MTVTKLLGPSYGKGKILLPKPRNFFSEGPKVVQNLANFKKMS